MKRLLIAISVLTFPAIATAQEPADVLAFTPEMRRVALQAAGGGTQYDRLLRLQRFLFDSDRIAFDYDMERTATAADAFAAGRGNCVAFTNLFIALGRSIDIPVEAALVREREGGELEGDLIVVRNHVVAVFRDGVNLRVFDFYGRRTDEIGEVQPIDDSWNAAIYVNNLGVEALRHGDLTGAQQRFERAAVLAPRYGAVHSNLGVARRRRGDTDGAIDAYLIAMAVDRRDTAVRTNLGALFRSRLLRPESDPLVLRGDRALVEGRIRRAARLYRVAARRNPDTVEPLLALARTQLLAARLDAARRTLAGLLETHSGCEEARRLAQALDRLSARS